MGLRRTGSRGSRWPALVLCSALAGLAGPRLTAQVVDDMRLDEANAQLDFWLPAPRRPDTELTNSMSLHVTTDGALLAARWFHVPSCGAASDAQACTTTDLEIGQDMYTPAGATEVAAPQPGARPYAGWLYVAATTRVATPSFADALTVEAGVTGPPSLAGQIQTAWHQLIGYPRALGWSHQIPFTPGIVLDGDRAEEVRQVTLDGVPILSVVPNAGFSVGNIVTGAHVGVDARLGYGITTPWSSMVRGRGRRVELYALAAAREDAIAYSLFLDGSTTTPATHVEKEPLVFQYAFGGGARFGRLEVEYRGVTREREYTTGPPLHPYAVLSVGIRPGW